MTKQTAANARVSSTGAINWGPLGTYDTTCSLDITFYPFDTQACDVVIDLWSSTESEVRTKAHSYTIVYTGYNTTVSLHRRAGIMQVLGLAVWGILLVRSSPR